MHLLEFLKKNSATMPFEAPKRMKLLKQTIVHTDNAKQDQNLRYFMREEKENFYR